MTRIIDIDPRFLKRVHENFWLDQDDTSFGAGLDGREQIVFAENRRWIGRLDFARLRTDALRRATIIGDQLRGRVGVLRVPLCNNWTPRFRGDLARFYETAGVLPAHVAQGFIPYSDDSPFSDGKGFALPDPSEPTAGIDAAAGASVLSISGFIGRNLTPGAVFSINDFMYRVEGNDRGTVTFNPPLREAVQAGALVDVSIPHVRVRLASRADWRPFRNYLRNGSPMTVNVVEAFDR